MILLDAKIILLGSNMLKTFFNSEVHFLPEGGPDTPLRLCLSPVTAFVPLWPGCVITWDGPGRLQMIPGDEDRRWEEVGAEKRFWVGKASKATKLLVCQS